MVQTWILLVILLLSGCQSDPERAMSHGDLSVNEVAEAIAAENIPVAPSADKYSWLAGTAPAAYRLGGEEKLLVFTFSGPRVPHKAYEDYDKRTSSEEKAHIVLYRVKNALLLYVHHAPADGAKPPRTEYGSRIERVLDKLHGDEVEDVHGNIANKTKLESFISHIRSYTPDRMRITRFTIEGDPIFYDIVYDGKQYLLSIDNSEDAFAGSDSKQPKTYTCGGLAETSAEEVTHYALTACSGFSEPFPLLSIPHAIIKE
ncbi:DUF4362 domain-containing protein [Paenibacillus thalictri]|uniref:DUF4362 domain-containing protein n=1 Tax=Paenibacillus thalictri TaxID=2527873 RepID=A0A4Q9DJN8_9BACL|nr:DUF4362 domain-containing protein [Paenibacillus thalictri]TBL71191.1 DUF4362 domain-containing protein [Paenibacillus thalictri]